MINKFLVYIHVFNFFINVSFFLLPSLSPFLHGGLSMTTLQVQSTVNLKLETRSLCGEFIIIENDAVSAVIFTE